MANTITNGASAFTGGWRELFNGDFQKGLGNILYGGVEAAYGPDAVEMSNVIIDSVGECSKNSLLKAKVTGQLVPFMQYLSDIKQMLATKGVNLNDAIIQSIRENAIKNGLTWIDMYDAPQSVLPNNGILRTGRYLVSPYGNYYLVMQADGNLVLYSSGQFIHHFATWSSGTNGKGSGPYRLVMQDDANLVIYDSTGTPTWASNTYSANPSSSYRLALQDDGNLVMYDANNGVVFASNTQDANPPTYPDSIPQNGAYTAGNFILSRNKNYKFTIQTDCNLVLYDVSGDGDGRPVWASNTGGNTTATAQLNMQPDANLVVYNVSNPGRPVSLWDSNSVQNGIDGPYHIVMQNDRNCVIYNGHGDAIWSTHTDNN